jgi:hypothetical protein
MRSDSRRSLRPVSSEILRERANPLTNNTDNYERTTSPPLKNFVLRTKFEGGKV